MQPTFVVLYRWKLHAGAEDDFVEHGHVFRQNYVMKEARWAHAYTMAQTVFGTAMHNGLTCNSARKPLPWAQLILRRRYE